MSSYDKRWNIERYPIGDGRQYSYGCPELDLMGYEEIDELLMMVLREIRKQESF